MINDTTFVLKHFLNVHNQKIHTINICLTILIREKKTVLNAFKIGINTRLCVTGQKKMQKSDSSGIRNEIQYEHYLSSSVVITISYRYIGKG